jgi:hypothetical protein
MDDDAVAMMKARIAAFPLDGDRALTTFDSTDDGFGVYEERCQPSTTLEMAEHCRRSRFLRHEALWGSDLHVLLQFTIEPTTYMLSSGRSERRHYYVVQQITTRLSKRRRGLATSFLGELESLAQREGHGVHVQSVASEAMRALLERRGYSKTTCGGYVSTNNRDTLNF